MNQNNKNDFLLEKMKSLNPDYIPEASFIKPQTSSSVKSRAMKLSLLAAGVLSIVLVITFNSPEVVQETIESPEKQVFEILNNETMNPNLLWHKKQLKVSIINGG